MSDAQPSDGRRRARGFDGWRASISLEDGIAKTYRWFLANEDEIRS